MVVQSGFEIELFNPDTNQAHKEFTKDGKAYVEAYPDAQYFIHLKCVDTIHWRGRKLEAHFFVDGKDLGYRHWVPVNGDVMKVGIKMSNGDKKALAFTLPKLLSVGANAGTYARTGVCRNLVVVSAIASQSIFFLAFMAQVPACRW